ncbi:L-threonylcarbamoyladenylate synthase [Emticicia sp. BO119]|uniref:L-threonylcarbamoyladenylate synthase n=1 Tax=Emticicia sp. BO119 TaxID=2757768 RepID=UPI0015F0A0C3|nr:L-threonylcarbamoyladenylate synthase [Emticicia sp. BO119]MBA4849915.1 threonylcarbamoyl-AMP synthase [Emticicia sp. BO119]
MAHIGKDIEKAIRLLNDGEVIGIPTETVYGLAGNALNNDTVARIFEVKNRPSFDPLIIHTNSIKRFQNYISEIDERVYTLAEKFMPGPLTLLLPRKDIIPDLVTSGLENVAIRIPNHPLTLELLSQLEFPLAAPSANPFGYISPTNAIHVNNQLGDKIKYILDGGDCQVGIESTIVGFVDNEAIIYRKGGLSIEAIETIVGKVNVIEHSSSNPLAPGMLKSHYAPKKPLILLNKNQVIEPEKKKIAYLGFKQYNPFIPVENQLLLSPNGDFREAARHLFAYMRYLDAMDVDIIYTELLPEKELGRAINDRIRRATVKE